MIRNRVFRVAMPARACCHSPPLFSARWKPGEQRRNARKGMMSFSTRCWTRSASRKESCRNARKGMMSFSTNAGSEKCDRRAVMRRNARKGMMSFSTRGPPNPIREVCYGSQCPQGHDVFLHGNEMSRYLNNSRRNARKGMMSFST